MCLSNHPEFLVDPLCCVSCKSILLRIANREEMHFKCNLSLTLLCVLNFSKTISKLHFLVT